MGAQVVAIWAQVLEIVRCCIRLLRCTLQGAAYRTSLTMRRIVTLLLSMTCTGHGRRVQQELSSEWKQRSDTVIKSPPMKEFAFFLLTTIPTATWQVHTAGSALAR